MKFNFYDTSSCSTLGSGSTDDSLETLLSDMGFDPEGIQPDETILSDLGLNQDEELMEIGPEFQPPEELEDDGYDGGPANDFSQAELTAMGFSPNAIELLLSEPTFVWQEFRNNPEYRDAALNTIGMPDEPSLPRPIPTDAAHPDCSGHPCGWGESCSACEPIHNDENAPYCPRDLEACTCTEENQCGNWCSCDYLTELFGEQTTCNACVAAMLPPTSEW